MEKLTNNQEWLAHWIYDRAEWNRFTRWRQFKRGLGYYLLYFLHPGRGKSGAEIMISTGEVCIKDAHHTFSTGGNPLIRAEIHEAGSRYILDIFYRKGKDTGVVRIPVPRGKLKEAVRVESRLQETGTV
ncbi:MAG: hypothetical protein HYZ15_05410 [Sphingobacteriales bacterium]|nr:hypothetical protein [Sphingobacteriales bacterium]